MAYISMENDKPVLDCKLLLLFSHGYYLCGCLPFATTPLFFVVTAGAVVVGEAHEDEDDEDMGTGVARLEPPLVRNATKPASWPPPCAPRTALSPPGPRLASWLAALSPTSRSHMSPTPALCRGSMLYCNEYRFLRWIGGTNRPVARHSITLGEM